MMRVYRLTKKKYSTSLSGKGAAKFGNRWNSKGTEIIYTADSRALAMAEVAVHLSFGTLPSDYVMMEINIPPSIKIKRIIEKDLPENWKSHPPKISTQKIGDNFIAALDFCALRVPSAVVQGDYNYLLNPFHKDFKKVKIVGVQDFPFDKRFLSG